MASKSSSDTKSAVLSYLTAQNRPYSTNDVVSNLHNEHGKTAVQKALDILVAEGKVGEKVRFYSGMGRCFSGLEN